tara:strand:+ start:47 stop:337 length:291 start_codon:yes stop_codon:yes gene_type:complete
MFVLFCGGIVATFSVSFALSYYITSDILKHPLLSFLLQIKSPPKVKFEQYVSVRHIPHLRTISSDSLSKLWYSKVDYENFKYCYMKKNGKNNYNRV